MATHLESEREFLDAQAALARRGMAEALQSMKSTALRAADPQVCAQKHPWMVAGAAVAAGFVAGTFLTPGRPVREPERRATSSVRSPVDPLGLPPSDNKNWWSTVVVALTTAVSTGLQGALLAAADSYFTRRAGASDEPASGQSPQNPSAPVVSEPSAAAETRVFHQ